MICNSVTDCEHLYTGVIYRIDCIVENYGALEFNTKKNFGLTELCVYLEKTNKEL